MNTKDLIVAVAVFAAAGAAQADQTYPYVDHSNVNSTKTRAEVLAELEQAYITGRYTSTNTPEFAAQTSIAANKASDEMRKETIQAAKGK